MPKFKLIPKPATEEQRAQRLIDFIAVEVTTCTRGGCDGVAIPTSHPSLTLCAEHLEKFRDAIKGRIEKALVGVLQKHMSSPYTDDGRAAITRAVSAIFEEEMSRGDDA